MHHSHYWHTMHQQTMQAYLIVFGLQLYDAVQQWYSSVLDWYHSACLVHECSDLRIRVPHEDGIYCIKGCCTELAVFEAVEEVWQSVFIPCPSCRTAKKRWVHYFLLYN